MAIDPTALPPTAPMNGASADDAAPAAPADDASGGKTVEEVEAFWKNRVSQKDRGHLAAERTLRDEIESLRRQQVTQAATGSPAGQGTDGSSGINPADLTRLQRELEAERAGRVIDQRKAKYPALVAQGITDAVFSTADDASLAKLNALADDNAAGGFIAPTAPRRTASTPAKPLHEQTKDELLAQLREASKQEVIDAALR